MDEISPLFNDWEEDMKEPIPFFGIYESDEEDMETYLRQQLQVQQMLINQMQKDVAYWKGMFEKLMGMMENKNE